MVPQFVVMKLKAPTCVGSPSGQSDALEKPLYMIRSWASVPFQTFRAATMAFATSGYVTAAQYTVGPTFSVSRSIFTF